MKLLKIKANNFKLCKDDFTISFIPTGNKTEDDKEFELEKVDENLYVFSTIGIIGKNASGKTSVTELLSIVYDIFSFFRVRVMSNLIIMWAKDIDLDITFYNQGYLYRYTTTIYSDKSSNLIFFKNEKLYKKKYFKSYSQDLFNDNEYELVPVTMSLPKDTSRLYEVFNTISMRGLYFGSSDIGYRNYSSTFDIYKMLNKKNSNLVAATLKMFDKHLQNIIKTDEDRYKIYYSDGKTNEVTGRELYSILSSGTTKGFELYTFAIYSLLNGSDLVVDEIENHFHKTLVENLVNLYKDKSVNKKNATLIFTTHNAELLDLFSRSDDIYITKYDNKIELKNAQDYITRRDLLKSKKFYSNAFDTNVDYEALMNFKRNLMQ